MVSKKLTNVADGTDPEDAVTKKQLDNSSAITKNIDLKNQYNILNRKTRTFQQLKADDESLVSFEEVKEIFVGIREAEAMQTYLDIGNNYIYNIKTPTANDQAANKDYVDTTQTNTMSAAAMIHAIKAELGDYLKKDGTTAMTGNLNMDNNRLVNLLTPSGLNQPTKKFYTDSHFPNLNGQTAMTGRLNTNNNKIVGLEAPAVDDNKADLCNYLRLDGTRAMQGILNMDSHKITNLHMDYTSGTDAVNKSMLIT